MCMWTNVLGPYHTQLRYLPYRPTPLNFLVVKIFVMFLPFAQ